MKTLENLNARPAGQSPELRSGDLVLCRCGCGTPASYLCTGYSYDPAKPGSRGERFVAEPCCGSAMSYLVEGAPELGLPPVVATPIRPQNNEASNAHSKA